MLILYEEVCLVVIPGSLSVCGEEKWKCHQQCLWMTGGKIQQHPV